MTDSGSDRNARPLDLVPLPGSEKQPFGGVRAAVETPPADATVEATVILRRRAALSAQDAADGGLSSSQLAERFGAAPADVEVVEQTFTSLGLRILSSDPASRRIRISGSVATVSRVFGTSLSSGTSTDGD